MNISLPSILFPVVCVVLLVSCNVQSAVMPNTPVPLPSPTKTVFVFYYYDWKKNWLNNATCAPPCWEGITPGQSSLQEATEFIEDIPRVEIQYTSKDEIEWWANSYRGRVVTGDGYSTILYITTQFDSDEYISLQDAISVFGQPTDVEIYACIHSMCYVNAIYPEFGLALQFELKSPEKSVKIEESTNVLAAIFFIPGMNNYMNLPPFKDGLFKRWNGYGIYSE